VTPHPDDDAFKVCLRIRKDTIRRDVSGKCVGEKVPIASEFSPRVDAADDAALDPRYSGQRLSQSGVTIFSFEVDGSYVALAMHARLLRTALRGSGLATTTACAVQHQTSDPIMSRPVGVL